MTYTLADEPRDLEAADLNRHKGASSRARASILGYNEIMWNKGTIHNQGAVDDLDFDTTLSQETTAWFDDLEIPCSLLPSSTSLGFEGVDVLFDVLQSADLTNDMAGGCQAYENFGNLVSEIDPPWAFDGWIQD